MLFYKQLQCTWFVLKVKKKCQINYLLSSSTSNQHLYLFCLLHIPASNKLLSAHNNGQLFNDKKVFFPNFHWKYWNCQGVIKRTILCLNICWLTENSVIHLFILFFCYFGRQKQQQYQFISSSVQLHFFVVCRFPKFNGRNACVHVKLIRIERFAHFERSHFIFIFTIQI